MSVTEYRRRGSLSQQAEVLWRAHADRLEEIGADGDVARTIHYRNVRQVRLVSAPRRGQPSRFLMEIGSARIRHVLSNSHFDESGEMEDRSDTFFPLVRRVVAGVRAANPEARFTTGEQPALYWTLFAFSLAVFTLLLFLILFLPVTPYDTSLSSVIKAALIVFSLALLLAWAIESRPRRFRPVRDLEKVLAGETG
jgi:hypothetical protein